MIGHIDDVRVAPVHGGYGSEGHVAYLLLLEFKDGEVIRVPITEAQAKEIEAKEPGG